MPATKVIRDRLIELYFNNGCYKCGNNFGVDTCDCCKETICHKHSKKLPFDKGFLTVCEDCIKYAHESVRIPQQEFINIKKGAQKCQ